MITPYYQRDGVILYHGDARNIVPRFTRRGIVILDTPYSERVHKNAVSAGRRREPLLDGNNRLSRSAISRKVDLGFEPLTPEFRRFCAREAARLASRWALFFCDGEGLGKWADDLDAAGIPYRTHCVWKKECGSPNFNGCEAARPSESIALAGEDPEELIESGGYVACAHRDPDKRDGTPARFWNRGGSLGFYPVPVCKASHGEQRINETQKSERLIEDLILDWTEPGEHLIDWTAGGCTLGYVGAKLGHPVTLVEKRESQCEAAAKRLDALFDKPEVIAAATRERVARWVQAKRERAAGAAERKEIREAMKRQTSVFDLPGVAAAMGGGDSEMEAAQA